MLSFLKSLPNIAVDLRKKKNNACIKCVYRDDEMFTETMELLRGYTKYMIIKLSRRTPERELFGITSKRMDANHRL